MSYHNIFKDALQLRLHWKRHVCNTEGSNFYPNIAEENKLSAS